MTFDKLLFRNAVTFLVVTAFLFAGCGGSKTITQKTSNPRSELTIEIEGLKGDEFRPDADGKAKLICKIKNMGSRPLEFFAETDDPGFTIHGKGDSHDNAMELTFHAPFWGKQQTLVVLTESEEMVFTASLTELFGLDKAENPKWGWTSFEKSRKASSPLQSEQGFVKTMEIWFSIKIKDEVYTSEKVRVSIAS